ncbi:MAG TPA: hypothetical protein VK839_07375 [Erythrobacter sp.]|nr:hypothetical protein [Erythrobacter sp.]
MLRLLAAPAILLTIAACSQPEEAAPPAETAAEDVSLASASRDEDIRHFLAQEYADYLPLSYAVAWTDLDSDGTDEAIVHVVSPMLCGSGGCNTLVLASAGPMWRKVGDISVSRTPIAVMESSNNGWKDIAVAIAGGGGPSGSALLKFDGTKYPSNPTVPPAEMTEAAGNQVLAEEPELIELKPETESAD